MKRPKTHSKTHPRTLPPRTTRPSTKRRGLVARLRGSGARIAAWASDPQLSVVLAVGFTIAHAVLWTAILTQLKAAQDIHYDVAEAYAWGQKFLLGYGKHPPLSGWIAGAWFSLFPTTDFAAYGLAMATVGIGMLATWGIALHVVDRRRAFFVLVMVALYPIFNFKGFKFNADLVQLISLPLLVLAYLHAFEKRSIRSGVLFGFAGALALLCKYWVVTMIGAIGLAALLHPQRAAFLRSPAPWVALLAMAGAMIPHADWVRSVDYAPFRYATGTYPISSRWENLHLVWGYVGHNAALLALPLALAAAVLGWTPRWWGFAARDPRGFLARPWSLRDNAAVNRDQALNVWLIQGIVAVGPPLGALIFDVYIKTDWGISLFFLVPLSVVAIPSLRVPRIALPRLAAIWLVLTLATWALAPRIALLSIPRDAQGNSAHVSYSQLARQLTEVWHTRVYARWSAVIGFVDVAEQMTFYSPDHPMPLTPYEPWPSGLLTLDQARREGFIGICEVGDWRGDRCDAWMRENAAGAERVVMSTRRFFAGQAGTLSRWNVYLVPPVK